MVTKQTTLEELTVLSKLRGAAHVQQLISSKTTRRENTGKCVLIRTEYSGKDMRALPHGRYIYNGLIEEFKCEMREALTAVRRAGYRHKDITPRNVTFDSHNGFTLIDFDDVEQSGEWNVEEELNEVLETFARDSSWRFS